MKAITTLTRGGMITIPAEFRRKRMLKEGTKLAIVDTEEGLVLIPIIPLEKMRGTEDRKVANEICTELITEHRKEAKSP